MFSIRQATVADCDDIYQLLNEQMAYHGITDLRNHTLDEFKRCMFGEDKHLECFVAEVKENSSTSNLVGFTLFFKSFSLLDGNALFLECFFVRPEHRSKGIGAELFKSVAKTAVERGCKRVDWFIEKKNTKAVEFYKRRGSIDVTTDEGVHLFTLKREEMETLTSKIK